MKISIISDTHNQHAGLGKLSGDVLIHCGDMLHLFRKGDSDLQDMDDWFGRQDFDLILCTGGNHDLQIEELAQHGIEPFENAVFLQDQRWVHDGVVFYGAPWIPGLLGHAFFLDDSDLRERWSQIPDDTDVLITHTPPRSVLDVSSRGLRLGCEHLAEAVDRVAPAVHCFGHVHASAGIVESKRTVFVNASLVNSRFELARGPVVLEM